MSFLPVFTVYLQQFFERKRLLKRNELLQYNNGLQTPLDRKSVVSQDIKGFCLLEQMHSTEMLCKYFFLQMTKYYREMIIKTPDLQLNFIPKL